MVKVHLFSYHRSMDDTDSLLINGYLHALVQYDSEFRIPSHELGIDDEKRSADNKTS